MTAIATRMPIHAEDPATAGVDRGPGPECTAAELARLIGRLELEFLPAGADPEPGASPHGRARMAGELMDAVRHVIERNQALLLRAAEEAINRVLESSNRECQGFLEETRQEGGE